MPEEMDGLESESAWTSVMKAELIAEDQSAKELGQLERLMQDGVQIFVVLPRVFGVIHQHLPVVHGAKSKLGIFVLHRSEVNPWCPVEIKKGKIRCLSTSRRPTVGVDGKAEIPLERVGVYMAHAWRR